jgi:hypothetical protein
MLDDMKTIFTKVCKDFEAELIEFDGEGNHVHLLVNYPPKMEISKLVNSLKGVSSRLLRKNILNFYKDYWKGVLWSPLSLPVRAVALLFLSLNNILSKKTHLINLLTLVNALISHPGMAGFTRFQIRR